MAQISYGTITITDTTDIERIYMEYCRSTSNQLNGTIVPDITRAWEESTPQWIDGEYIWQRAVVEKSGTPSTKTYGTPVCITGAQGETGEQGLQGETGAAGRSLTSTQTEYTAAATNASITQVNMSNYTWTSNVPTYNANTPVYWVRVTNIYENPSSTVYIIYKDNGITDAIKTSNDANAAATRAEGLASNADTNATNALNKAQAKYATSTTAKGTAAKIAILNPVVNSWTIFNGAEIFVKFTYENTVSNPTLAIKPSSSGTATTAASIRDSDGNALDSKFYWKNGSLVHFVYDGSYWRILDIVTTEKYNNLVSDISGLSSTVGSHTTEISSLGTRVSTNESNISQNATNISLKVSETDFTGNNIVSKINLDSTTATISANRVNIEGAAIFTNGRLSENNLNSTYDANGAAAEAQTNAITSANSYTDTKTSNMATTVDINQLKANYGTSNTSASTRIKTVSCNNFVLESGNEITVYFSTANTQYSNSVQLNINNTGAKDVWVANAITSSTNQLLWGAGAYITFKYIVASSSSSYFIVIGEPRSWYGASTTSASTAAKTDTTAITGCVICKGAKIELAMTNANTSTSATLNIQSTGAKNIYYGNTTTRPTIDNGHAWIAATTATFTFDGSNYRLQGQTVINGDNVTTGTISANRLDVAGIITAGTIAVTSDIPTDLSDLNNDTGYITSASVPTKVSQLTNDSGYQDSTQVDNAVSTGISNASVTDLSDGNNYYTSTQTQNYVTGLGYQTSSDVNGAISTATSGLASKGDATYRTQRIYRRYTAAQSNLSGPTTWVTANTNIYNNWTTKIPPLTNGSTKYPYLYTCVQKQTITQYNNGSGTGCTCTSVLLDDTTTVIDGGSIIAGSVTANEITGSKLSAIYADMGNITAGNITKGYNSINFDNSPATLEFKNNSTWATATKGIQWTGSDLNIKGNITATSLTIGGTSGYNGIDALNITGYTIEILQNSSHSSIINPTENIWIYPVLYHNNNVVTVSDGRAFKWYKDNDTENPIIGNQIDGGMLGVYGSTYRVTYTFEDGAVVDGASPVQQNITVSDATHITEISNNGIKVHHSTNNNNYIQIDSTGLEVVQGGTSVAKYGTAARIGATTGSRFLMNSDSLQAYNSSGTKYFEVTSGGLNWNNGTTTNYITYDASNGLQIASASPSTATRKIQILNNGINIKNDSNNYLSITSSKIALFKNNIEKLQLTDSLLRLGDSNNYVNLDTNGMKIWKDSDKIADFGTNIILGSDDSTHSIFTSSALEFYTNSTNKAVSIGNDGTFKIYNTDAFPIMTVGHFNSHQGILLDALDLTKTGGHLFGIGSSLSSGGGNYASHVTLRSYAEPSTVSGGYSDAYLGIEAMSNRGLSYHYIQISTTSVSGEWSGIESSVAITVNSDERLKENCVPINELSNLLFNIEPIIYSWKDKRTEQRYFGFKAQNVKEALSKIVNNTDDFALVGKNRDGYLNLSYTELIPLMVDIIQKHEKRITELETQLEGGIN